MSERDREERDLYVCERERGGACADEFKETLELLEVRSGEKEKEREGVRSRALACGRVWACMCVCSCDLVCVRLCVRVRLCVCVCARARARSMCACECGEGEMRHPKAGADKGMGKKMHSSTSSTWVPYTLTPKPKIGHRCTGERMHSLTSSTWCPRTRAASSTELFDRGHMVSL